MFKNVLKNIDIYFSQMALAFITVVVLILIFTRYIYSIALPELEEFNMLLFVWYLYFTIIICTRYDGHIRAGTIDSLLSSKWRLLVKAVADTICLIFYGAMVYVSVLLVTFNIKLSRPTTYLHIPMYLVYLILPISFAIMAIFSIQNIRNSLIAIKRM